jgi:Glycine zipper
LTRNINDVFSRNGTMIVTLLNHVGGNMKSQCAMLVLVMSLAGCSTPLTTREEGAGIGTFGGAAAGGIIGSVVGHAGAGAAIGGLLGLGAGALIGDQLQGQEIKHDEQQKNIEENQKEIERQKREIENLQRDQDDQSSRGRISG